MNMSADDDPSAKKPDLPVAFKKGDELAKPHEKAWWKEGPVYQIYPLSFSDGNGDGTGDLRGIINKLDYLKDLGVGVVWLSPIFDSPLVDCGYDISDYKKILPIFGTVQDVEELATKAHERGMKLMLDLVVNHTSDQHEWFTESRKSKESEKRDWYIWRPAKKDEKTGERRPPNNWTAVFGGSAWEWDEGSQEYFLHYFCPEQPDLNWENPLVRNAVWDVMHFWLSKGVDGFRQDVINMISKVPGLPDAKITDPSKFLQNGFEYFTDGPRMHEFLHEMYTEVLCKYDMMTVGEMPGVYEVDKMLEYVQKDRQELQMAFDFALVNLDSVRSHKDDKKKWQLNEFKEVITRWNEGLYEGWWAIYLENHDQPRTVSRWTNDSPQWRYKSSKLLATFQLSLFGTPYIYQGQEIGHINLPDSVPDEEFIDVQTINWIKGIKEAKERGDVTDVEAEIKYVRARARDNARSPVQWSSAPHGGFTTPEAKPWMIVSPDYKTCNVEAQLDDPKSVRSYWKKMMALRKSEECLTYGRFRHISSTHESIFAYTRAAVSTTASGGYDIFLVVLNFTETAVDYDIPVDEHPYIGDLTKAKKVIGSYDEEEEGSSEGGFNGDKISLRPYEALVWRVGAE